MGFPGGSDGKESTYNVGDLDSIIGLRSCPGGWYGNPFQYSCMENPYGQRSLKGYSPWGHKESDVTEDSTKYKKLWRNAFINKALNSFGWEFVFQDGISQFSSVQSLRDQLTLLAKQLENIYVNSF